MAGNRIELWGRLLAAPELRTTPAGTSVLRITVDGAPEPGALKLAVVMTGAAAQRLHSQLSAGAEVKVKGALKTVRRRLKSGIMQDEYEVVAETISREGSGPTKD